MKKLVVTKPKFQKSSLEPERCNNQSLPFMFAAPISQTSEQYRQKLSFVSEITKVSSRIIGPILDKNISKDRIPNELSTESCLPYKRRARSFSPPKDPLKVIEKESLFFPMGAPIMPIPRNFRLEEDSELKALREEYIKMLESAQETVVTECDESGKEDPNAEIVVFDSLNNMRYARCVFLSI